MSLVVLAGCLLAALAIGIVIGASRLERLADEECAQLGDGIPHPEAPSQSAHFALIRGGR